MHRILLICLLLLGMQGCVSVPQLSDTAVTGSDQSCVEWFTNIDTSLHAYHDTDPGTESVNGFPQLRVNRFLASITDQVLTQADFSEWLEQARQLDFTEKTLGIANLPAAVRQALLTKQPKPGGFAEAVTDCGKRLNQLSLNNPEHEKRLLTVKVGDAYHDWQRALGLYPLFKYAARLGLDRLHRELRASFNSPVEKLPTQGKLIRYRFEERTALTPQTITAMLNKAYQNPLKMPVLTTQQTQQLLANFAPVWAIDTRNDTDKIGTVTLNKTGRPFIDTQQATVYVSTAYTRWHEQILLQLIYQIWLPAREKTGCFDWYGGPFDSVIWRVTLSIKGEPIAYDSIHGCGCYYLLFPGHGYQALAKAEDGAEPVLSPKSIPTLPAGQRLLLNLQTRTHYLQQLSLIDDTVSAASHSYVFQDLKQLRSLPLPDGNSRSLYAENGILEDSIRSEKYLLWPFGVTSPGAMRQWGTHAIAFIGKRHFDDAFLFEHLLTSNRTTLR